MNLLENEQYGQKKPKSKMIMRIIIVVIILLLIVSAGLLYMIYDVEKNALKLYIDNKSISSVSKDLFLFEDDYIYISIKDFAPLVNYTVYKGDHTSETNSKGYIQNEYEETSYELNSNIIYKNLLGNTDIEYFEIEKPVKIKNNKLYIGMDGISIATESSISYNKENNKFTVYTLDKLAEIYTEKNIDSAVGDDKADYSNKKALLYDMIVVKDENEKYGVRDLNNKEIIGKKYSSMKFIESSKEFIVTTDDKKMGILSSTGMTTIRPQYDEIKRIDKELNLYLVKNNNKYGIIDKSEKIIIHLEYDKIGIDLAQFKENNIKNQYLLFDNCIPVQRDKKWGFFDKNGNKLTEIEYDEIGCVKSTQSGTTSYNLLIIPECEGIVIGKDTKYGLINSLGTGLLKNQLDSMYFTIISGKYTYHMSLGDTSLDILAYLKQHGLWTDNSGEDINMNLNVEANEENTVDNTNSVTDNTVNNTNNTTNNTNIVNQ